MGDRTAIFETADAQAVPPGETRPVPGVQQNSGQAEAGSAAMGWSDVVERIRRDDPSGMEDLYRVFRKGVRFFLYRQLGPRDLDDKVHDVFVIVIKAIQRGDLREPERLMGFIRTVIRRQVAGHIEQIAPERRQRADLDDVLRLVVDHRADPERDAIDQQNAEVAGRMLRSIRKRDREVLIRFYVREQSAETICAEMGLTATQFRLIKSRAKARYVEMCQARLRVAPCTSAGREAEDGQRASWPAGTMC